MMIKARAIICTEIQSKALQRECIALSDHVFL